MRLLLVFLALALLVLIPFFFWGDALESFFTFSGSVDWLEGYGAWAWAMAIVLLIGDLFLPLPATVIMAALGLLYGPWWGGALAATGSFLSGALAYELCQRIGPNAARRILSEGDLDRGQRLFSRAGGWIVAFSRWIPVLPEVVACMAGLTCMPAPLFYGALACGSLPLGFTFAAVGHFGLERPVLTLVLSALVPMLLWLAVRPLLKWEQR
ncbi:Uncharacterized membrane protein YdjX, TVP38/TMEM64 family, SNARE-associated domain [Catalinimonas alkaloidigena]|uniref:Uncharacterized membrane protein YdjX, TVP38/TMEM64 family, SNARE-associated domain n=1 Tax=Catalinimonas alkaloidigena TaxID=1075417 RepID=A0A1G9HEV0_9BACT|nr:VTT domain-containing protein [Catalinimonas alkaloidigena]SDL11520.1 Uncharacterized membrane protein YdjX, TVP38/TMEM64 family, SNARE-associated domain [Catalinimonas alkaloidigena]